MMLLILVVIHAETVCDSNQYIDGTFQTCKDCYSACLTCNDGSNENCMSCKDEGKLCNNNFCIIAKVFNILTQLIKHPTIVLRKSML